MPFFGFSQNSIDSTGLLGDNFSLEAALECFKTSETLEAFENKLNSEEFFANNLDLNDDKKVDYIKVIDNVDGNVHAIVLQVDLDAKESQDIAVIEIEKTGEQSAILQIVGDPYLYGENVFVEPYEVGESNNGRGPNQELVIGAKIVVNVWLWPSVRFIYHPNYVIYRSPWRWAHYPSYWKPWSPKPWRWHYNKRSHLSVHYHTVSTHRVVRAHRIYTPKRKTSKVVYSKSVNRTVVKKSNTGKVTRVNKTAKTKKVSTSTKGRKAQKAGVKKTKTKKVKRKKK